MNNEITVVGAPTELQKALDALPAGTIKYEATFIPYSKVSAERKKGWSGDSKKPRLFLSWEVSINGEKFEYSAGIGHISDPELRKAALKGGWTIYEKEAIEARVEGKKVKHHTLGISSPAKQDPPALADVLSSLLLDSSALGANFEEWADNFGYDKDSRAAEKIYNASRENSYKLFRALGGALVDQLIVLEH